MPINAKKTMQNPHFSNLVFLVFFIEKWDVKQFYLKHSFLIEDNAE